MLTDDNITKGFALILVGVMLFSAVGTWELIDYFGDKGAQDQVYAKCMDPVSVEDVNIGQARLNAQLGFMDMDLQQLAEFYSSVDWNIDQYAYESWKLPSLFYDEREGDCEDFVLFALAVLDHHVYDLQLTLGKYDNVGHAWLIVNGSIMVDSIYGVCALNEVDMSHYVALLRYSDMLEGSLFQGILGRVATWDGGGADGLASTKENWDGPDIAPVAGDVIVFNTGSKACTFDIAKTFAGFYMNSSYSGIIICAKLVVKEPEVLTQSPELVIL